MNPSPEQPQTNRIMIRFCKESPFAKPISGKIDCCAVPLINSKSAAWEFFTEDSLPSRRAHLSHWAVMSMQNDGRHSLLECRQGLNLHILPDTFDTCSPPDTAL